MPTLFTSARLPRTGFITTSARLWQSTTTDCSRDWYSRSTEFISKGSRCPVNVPTPMPLITAAAMVSGRWSSTDNPASPTAASSRPSIATIPGRWNAPRIRIRIDTTPTPRLLVAIRMPAVVASQ